MKKRFIGGLFATALTAVILASCTGASTKTKDTSATKESSQNVTITETESSGDVTTTEEEKKEPCQVLTKEKWEELNDIMKTQSVIKESKSFYECKDLGIDTEIISTTMYDVTNNASKKIKRVYKNDKLIVYSEEIEQALPDENHTHRWVRTSENGSYTYGNRSIEPNTWVIRPGGFPSYSDEFVYSEKGYWYSEPGDISYTEYIYFFNDRLESVTDTMEGDQFDEFADGDETISVVGHMAYCREEITYSSWGNVSFVIPEKG